jgi:hypothetical protein
VSKAVLWVAAILIALGVAWWVVHSIGPTDDEAKAVAEEQERVAGRQAEAQAKVVAKMVDSVVAARLASVQTGTVIRELLTSPPPSRQTTPTNLDALRADSLVKIVRAKDVELDTAHARYNRLAAAVVADSLADARFRVFSDSANAAQARQIVAHQEQIRALRTIVSIQECRIARVLKCPSRKVAFLGGAVLAGGAMLYARER